MPDVVEPGTRLVERYRLEERLDGGAATAATSWLAHDELLDRPVSICLLAAGSPEGPEVLAAARRAAALTDARFLRVLDAAEQDGLVYVVSEWVASRTLDDLVSDGPLQPAEARDMALDLAGALATAHDAGLFHQTLRPEHVRRTPQGQVKLAGLAVSAAAERATASDPEEAAHRDTQGVGSVLYAALTGRWPGDSTTSLPPAPRDGDQPCSPRQVRAGVPDSLDDVAARALDLPGRHGGAPLHRADELRDALASLTLSPRHPVPQAARERTSAEPASDESPPEHSRVPGVAWMVVWLVLLVGLALAGGQLALNAFDDNDRPSSSEGATGDGPGGEDSVGPLEISSATTLDPPPRGNGEEHDEQAALAIDGDEGTAWSTMTYFDPLPLLKPGVGLVLDLGEQQSLSEITVDLPGGGTDVEIRVAETLGSAHDDFEKVAEENGVDGTAVLQLDGVQGRYVLVWLTDLPSAGESQYRGQISEITLRG